MDIFLVCDYIDLGYDVVSAYFNESEAEKEVAQLNKENRDTKIKQLVEIGYTEQQAYEYAVKSSDRFALISVEVKDKQ